MVPPCVTGELLLTDYDRTIGLLHNQGSRVACARFNLEWLRQP